jgi:hypothetical protein
MAIVVGPLTWIADICLAGATFGCIYMAAACLLVPRFARRRGRGLDAVPGVTKLDRMTRAMGRTVLTASTDDPPALEDAGTALPILLLLRP